MHRPVADTTAPSTLLPFESDELVVRAERADWLLLRLVLCAAAATLLLALASSLGR